MFPIENLASLLNEIDFNLFYDFKRTERINNCYWIIIVIFWYINEDLKYLCFWLWLIDNTI